MSPKKLFLIDGNAFCYRAYYAIQELKNSKGRPTNAVYGFLLMLKKLMNDERPDYLGIAFDVKGPTFRHKKFEEYKIHRKPMPEDLISQMDIIKDAVRAYNIPIFEKQGYEADDILATIAKRISKKGIDVYIVTGDKDALQLVDEHIKIYNTRKEGLIYDTEKVKERFSGLGPESILDLMALTGDTSDNIPGVKGIGEKTAIELIKEFKNIDNLYAHLDNIKSQAKQKMLSEYEEDARLSRDLATIDAHVAIEIHVDDMAIKEPNTEKLLGLFKELEFKAFAKEVAGDSNVNREADYKTITTIKQFDDFIEELSKQKEFAFDFETTSEMPLEAVPVGLSFSWEKGRACYVSLVGGEGVELEYAFEKLKPIMENEEVRKIGQNVKYEKLILANYGIELKGISFDTMIASYLLNPSKMNHNLDDIAFEYLSHKMTSIDELLGTGKKRIGMDMVSVEKVSEYSCADSDVTFRLKNLLEQELFKKELDKLFLDIEMPLVSVLSDIERNGVKIDIGLLRKTSIEMEKELSALMLDIYKLAGVEFNINSPKQLSQVLFEKIGLPIVKRTKTGASTDVEVLQNLALLHPLPKELLRYRELSKLKSTYIDALPELVNKKTGRLHTSFNQTITATGRLSSSNPNLQNIPIKSEDGKKIRKAFIGEGSNYILSADYSQIELRILAHLSRDRELIKALEEDSDVHTHTASLIFGVTENKVTPEMRQNAKTVNFGIMYGMSAFGLAKSLGIDQQASQEFIDAYFERYPSVKLYMEDKIEEAKNNGYVTTLFNRRRYIPEIKTGAMREKQQAERIAINTPVQGSAADLIKIAMINIHSEMKKRGFASKMILQVHDELVFEVPKKELQEVAKFVKSKMEGAVKLAVPVKVSVQYGENWLEMEEVT